jgi:phospholipase/carboxylesterase
VDESYLKPLSSITAATLTALAAVEQTLRHLHPPALPMLRERLTPHVARLETTLAEFRATTPPDELRAFHERFADGAALAQRAIGLLHEAPPPAEAIPRVLAGMRAFSRAQVSLYALHFFPPLGRWFVEPALHDAGDTLDPEPPAGVRVGVLHTDGQGTDARGGFSLYVPERYEGSEPWPLVVALHGGSGSGRDFLWTWVREARSRRFLLMAPTAQGPTWSLMGPDVDGPALRSMVEYVSSQWQVDSRRLLLTGLSDGATYTLRCGLQPDSPFTALAPVSGVLPPTALLEAGARIAGRRIYLVHGAQDWMFPVETARAARDALTAAGADLTFREIDDLSHTYPREENATILTWFDSSLTPA